MWNKNELRFSLLGLPCVESSDNTITIHRSERPSIREFLMRELRRLQGGAD